MGMSNPYEDSIDHRLSAGSLFGGGELDNVDNLEEEDEARLVQEDADDKDDATFGDEGIDDGPRS